MPSIEAKHRSLDAAQACSLLKALSDPLRLQVLEQLSTGERCVCDLTSSLALSQSRLSFHLKVMKEAGLLSDRQSGRWVYYRIRPESLNALQGWLQDLTHSCQTPASSCAE
ncbi:helix-turn-helix transcriptional regulator [Synechococcus sp. CS-197]|uniref:ArsR/SmtB family transcription factor n=1 Tax=Synechococcus sp. CS-197 TaxID=2847985 RepID=UPI0001525BDF|nr:metalloregulator ArsR/SmtB family transcription factor [Synechococcus sp. CS-197]MCT0250613.1 metalloregulator ArsR/SmtB family transcription factor [Synechococcus sp. CS-197]PTT92087.1 ArsR family transcriptional regulator [Pseudomonas sp. HMWF031]CAK23887.1 Predicted transcriptional regulator, arsR family [Synechococcus sp. WH 7803]